MAQLVAAHDVGDRAGDEEVLLLEPKGLALVALVVGIENFGDVLGVGLLFDGAAEVPLVEALEIEVASSARRTQAHSVHGAGAVARQDRAEIETSLVGERLGRFVEAEVEKT